MADKKLHDDALEYHAHPTPGKIAITITKKAETSHDLTLAYSPGVLNLFVKLLKIQNLLTITPLKGT